MKRTALYAVLAMAMFTAPAMAAVGFKEGHRMNSYYSVNSDKDMTIKKIVKLDRIDVKRIQLSLRNEGFNPGPIDGVYGWRTTAAMKKFQADRNLSVTGKATPASLGALRVATRVDFAHKLDRNYN